MKPIDITRLLFNLITGLVCSRFSCDVQLQQSLSKPEKVLIPMSNTSLISDLGNRANMEHTNVGAGVVVVVGAGLHKISK